MEEKVEQQANTIFLDAIKRVGELLHQADRAKRTNKRSVGRPKKTNSEPVPKPTLKDIGRESALSQKLAALPEEDSNQAKEGAKTVTQAVAKMRLVGFD